MSDSDCSNCDKSYNCKYYDYSYDCYLRKIETAKKYFNDYEFSRFLKIKNFIENKFKIMDSKGDSLEELEILKFHLEKFINICGGR